MTCRIYSCINPSCVSWICLTIDCRTFLSIRNTLPIYKVWTCRTTLSQAQSTEISLFWFNFNNLLQEPMLELPIILEVAKNLRCFDFSDNPMSLLPESCQKNATNMLQLLNILLSITKTREISAQCAWESDTLEYLLTRSGSCIKNASFQNLGLIHYPRDIVLHDVVVLNLSHNRINQISAQLSRLSALKSLILSHNAITTCKLEDVSLHIKINHVQAHAF